MGIECPICKVDFGVRHTGVKSSGMALICGHVYHETCIREWYKLTFQQKHGVPIGTTPKIRRLFYSQGKCPICSRHSFLRDARKLYLSVDNEKTCDELKKEVEKMRQVVASSEKKVEKLTAQLKAIRKVVCAKNRILKAQDKEIQAMQAMLNGKASHHNKLKKKLKK